MKTGINVGANKEAVVAARAVILEILKSDCEQATKQKALDTLLQICAIGPVTLTNCTVTNNPKHKS